MSSLPSFNGVFSRAAPTTRWFIGLQFEKKGKIITSINIMIFSQNFQYTIKRKGNENYENNHLRENHIIFCQILSTNSLSKCMEISLENLNLDIGA